MKEKCVENLTKKQCDGDCLKCLLHYCPIRINEYMEKGATVGESELKKGNFQ